MKGISLISKTMRRFAYCVVTCFLLTAPLFYLLTKGYYAEDMLKIVESVRQGDGIPKILDLEEDVAEGMMIQFVLIFAVISIALYVTMRFATKRIWLPFDDTLKKAEKFNLAKSDVPEFSHTDIKEFSRLNNTLEKLMRKDKDMFRIQKEFTENASHELQTPIAVIRTKLDLLMQEGLNEKQMSLVSDMYELTIRMGNLNRNLLLLAKIDNAQYADMEEVDLVSMLTESAPLYSTLQHDTTLKVEDKRKNQNATIKANDILLESMLKNLIVNAIRHSLPQSTIKINVEDKRLTVSNVSDNDTPLDPETIFRRFHTDKMQQKGNGLGLAIVKAICDFHHWNIAYRFEDGNHEFIVYFGKAN